MSSAKTLQISYIGMQTANVAIKPNVKVILKPDAQMIDEVVVTGYGNFKKSSFTGAASTVSTSKLQDIPSTSIEDKLAGNIPGVQISTSSGAPGATNYIRIRGMGSINAGNDPLIVIDGTPMVSGNVSMVSDATTGAGYNGAGTNILSTLNSNDIESMTVIKDAAAASLYGSRAANGVIVITTKSGRAGKTHIDFRSDWGFSNMAVNYRPTLDGESRRTLIYEGLKNYALDPSGGGYTTDADAVAYADGKIDKYAAKPANGWTDWKDLLFKTGSHQNYQIGVSGGSEKTQFYTSLSYTKQEGITPNTGLERMTGSANVSHQFNRFKVEVSSLFSSLNQALSNEGTSYDSPIMNYAFTQSPSQDPYDEEGEFQSCGIFGVNPLKEYQHSSDHNHLIRSYNTMAFEWNIWDNLKLREKIAYDYTSSTEDVLWDKESNNGAPTGVMQRFIQNLSTLNTQTQLSYIKSFGRHNVDALIGFETEDYANKQNYTVGQDYPGELYEIGNAGTTSASSELYQYRLTSFLGRVNYNYADKYYLGASFRRDGSSRLARENRWGSFWSVSGSWRFMEEPFLEAIKNVLTDGKLRLSYGVNGTQPSDYYGYMSLYKYGEYYNGTSGMGIVGVGNDNLKWEKNKAFNIGLDLNFWNRLSLTFDYYTRKTSDLIMNRPISAVPGYYDSSLLTASMMQNVGSMKNSGFELSLQSTNFQTKDFTWSTTLNISHNSNEVLALSGTSDQIISGPLIHKVGEPYYSYYMYEYAGVDSETGKEAYYINDGTENARKTTTNVSEAKQVIVGKHEPAVEGGLSNYMKWKFIDFNFTLTYSLGGEAYDYATWLHDNGGTYTYQGATPAYYKLEDMWKKPGDQAKLPKYEVGSGTSVLSSRWLMPTDYLRLKNLTIGFSVPQNFLNKAGISKARIYFSANNLLTWKSEDLYVDPETPVDGLCTFEMPALRTYTFGIEIGF